MAEFEVEANVAALGSPSKFNFQTHNSGDTILIYFPFSLPLSGRVSVFLTSVPSTAQAA